MDKSFDKSQDKPAKKPVDLPNIRNITISGRIGAGSTTLAKSLSKELGWRNLEGGDIFWEKVRSKLGLDSKDTNKRPDEEDKIFDEELKQMLKKENHLIIETKLAAFNAQGIGGIFKVLVICEDENGADQTSIRIDRLLNREEIGVSQAKEEVLEREKNDLDKWRKMYADGNSDWVYWDRKYYDLVVNTYSHNHEQSFKFVLEHLGFDQT